MPTAKWLRSRTRPLPARIGRWSASLLLLLLPLTHLAAAQTNSVPTKAGETANAMKALAAARSRFNRDTNNLDAAWQLGRACFDLANLATDNTAKAEVANEGIAACHRALALNSNSAPAHYYLGMSLGELADTKRNFSALRMVKEMEREFLAAQNLDEHFDFAGADRNLGLLYSEAPSFGSIGSRSKSRQHLQRAVELAPDYPENRLNLIEAYLRWGDRAGATRELKALEELWPEAQKRFTGPEHAADWPEWEKRLDAARKKLNESPKIIESPRQGE